MMNWSVAESIGRHHACSLMPFQAAHPGDFMQESQRYLSGHYGVVRTPTHRRKVRNMGPTKKSSFAEAVVTANQLAWTTTARQISAVGIFFAVLSCTSGSPSIRGTGGSPGQGGTSMPRTSGVSGGGGSGAGGSAGSGGVGTVSYTHLRAHETRHDLVCRLLLET